MEMRDEINSRRKEGWYEFLFSIEALAVDKSLVESALKEHIENLEKAPQVFVYEKNFYEAREVKNPVKGVEVAYSQVVNIKLFIKDLFRSLTAIMLYGPSSVEVLGPNKKEVSLSEIQSIANNISTLVHQFAAAGIGGMVMTPSSRDLARDAALDAAPKDAKKEESKDEHKDARN